jgi:hypothetical protein
MQAVNEAAQQKRNVKIGRTNKKRWFATNKQEKEIRENHAS